MLFALPRDRGGEPRTINLGSGAPGAPGAPLAYEDSGAPGVPNGCELHFEVEILSWLTVVDVCKNGGIVKKVLSTGGNRQIGDLDEVTGEHYVTNNLAPNVSCI